MDWLYTIALLILHAVWATSTFLTSALYSIFRRSSPTPLNFQRKQVPSHVAVAFAFSRELHDEDVDGIVKSIVHAVGWCRQAGIARLSFFCKDDTLLRHKDRIQTVLTHQATIEIPNSTDSSDSELDDLLTPPISLPSRSRSLSLVNSTERDIYSVEIRLPLEKAPQKPHQKAKRMTHSDAVTRWSFEPKPLSLTLLSRSASKPCLAAIAKSLTHWADPKSGLSCVALSDVNRLMGDMVASPSPELLIIHPVDPCHSLELHSFPPWLIRLTEIYYEPKSLRTLDDGVSVLSELTFRRALDEYNSAEMRLGK